MILSHYLDKKSPTSLFKIALALGITTILYNLMEGAASVYFGVVDETLTLFGFGVDSFVEVISAVGIVHMTGRLMRNGHKYRDKFEKRALKVTGTAFYLLTLGLLVGAFLTVYSGVKPESTVPGIVVSLISLATMYILYRVKLGVGQRLNSAPIISDAHCTRTCFYLSFILLASSLAYLWFGIQWIDAAGSVLIAWFAFKEGREAFEKASKDMHCADHC